MNFWSDQFWQLLESVAQDVEQVCWDVAQGIETFAAEVDDLMAALLDPLLDALVLEDELFFSSNGTPSKGIDADLCHHPACLGCQHYHGQTYGGHFLVCGMHPYGVEDSHCPDWESVWPSLQGTP